MDLPSAGRVDAIARACGVTADQRLRLEAALRRWFACDTASRAASYARMRAEVPFCTEVGGEGWRNGGDGDEGIQSFFLEGEIDLLCENGPDRPALVVDYKTGGKADEPRERLQEKHALQAQCYALAVLREGRPSVELRFVRVEQEDAACPGQPQEVVYRFEQADVPRLEKIVREAWRAARTKERPSAS